MFLAILVIAAVVGLSFSFKSDEKNVKSVADFAWTMILIVAAVVAIILV